MDIGGLTLSQYLAWLAVEAKTVINAQDYGRTISDLSLRRSPSCRALDPERFPPRMLHAGLLEVTWENREHYRWLARELGDNKSRDVLDAVLTFRQTLDPHVLAPVVEPELYRSDRLLGYGDDEVYIDGGAFDGDTIRLFSSQGGRALHAHMCVRTRL